MHKPHGFFGLSRHFCLAHICKLILLYIKVVNNKKKRAYRKKAETFFWMDVPALKIKKCAKYIMELILRKSLVLKFKKHNFNVHLGVF